MNRFEYVDRLRTMKIASNGPVQAFKRTVWTIGRPAAEVADNENPWSFPHLKTKTRDENLPFSVFKTSENVLAFFVAAPPIHFCTVAPTSDNVPYQYRCYGQNKSQMDENEVN